MTQAEKIREYVLINIIEPSRENGKSEVLVSAKEIHDALNLNKSFPAICSALDSKKFYDLAKVTLIHRDGPKESSTVKWTFGIRTPMNKVKRSLGENIQLYTKTLLNIIQIVAIIVGGIWTYNLFIKKDAPTLEPRADTNGNLTIQSISDTNQCLLNYDVSISNEGISTFDITEVTLSGWKFQSEIQPGNYSQFIDLQKIMFSEKSDKFASVTYTANDIDSDGILPFYIEHYPPGYEFSNTFSWVIQNDPNSWVLLHVLFNSEQDGKSYSWQCYHWVRLDCK